MELPGEDSVQLVAATCGAHGQGSYLDRSVPALAQTHEGAFYFPLLQVFEIPISHSLNHSFRDSLNPFLPPSESIPRPLVDSILGPLINDLLGLSSDLL